jgi:hypothetical protein
LCRLGPLIVSLQPRHVRSAGCDGVETLAEDARRIAAQEYRCGTGAPQTRVRNDLRNYRCTNAFTLGGDSDWGCNSRKIRDMRFLLGIIVGVFLTIGVAYVSDASTSGPTNTATQTNDGHRPMVNWDVVTTNWQSLSSGLRNTWNKLAAR